MSKPPRWTSVEEDELTVGNGGRRKQVVGVCSSVCHIRFTRFHRAKHVAKMQQCVL